MIRFTITGDREWRKVLFHLSTSFGRIAARPALESLADKMRTTLNSIFAPGSIHGYTGQYASSLQYTVSDTSMEIAEGIDGRGKFIRTGTSPSKYHNAMPTGVVDWAIDKLGVPRTSAFAIARSIGSRGIGAAGGQSPLPSEHPVGEGRFDFPEWMVTIKHKDDIEDLASAVRGLAVSYIRSH